MHLGRLASACPVVQVVGVVGVCVAVGEGQGEFGQSLVEQLFCDNRTGAVRFGFLIGRMLCWATLFYLGIWDLLD